MLALVVECNAIRGGSATLTRQAQSSQGTKGRPAIRGSSVVLPPFATLRCLRWKIPHHFAAENRCALWPDSQREPRAHAILRSERRWPMRAYVTAVGLMLGLVAVWAALVSFVA
jgi:hypothetical protein